MPPAARLSDPTAHGTPLTGAASPSVLVGGLPAWRALGDVHTCPLAVPATPPIPHVGGVVQPGSSSVLIEGLPASRLGDTVVEATIPNTVVGGCPTVLIGP
jgi:uncharacterized Zn-binding protein involved in type VI secretion